MTTQSTPANFSTLREQARDLLNEFDASDGLAAYYMLHHDAKRTTLFLHQDATGILDGGLARCQTGIDLFRPVITLRVRGVNDPVPSLIESALLPNRPYLLVMPAALEPRLASLLTLTDRSQNVILRLDPERFQPDMNTLVVTRSDPDGSPRAEIRRGSDVIASAGVNWRSPIFAEIYVQVEPEGRGHGWGRSVVRAVAADLLQRRVTPLYTIAEENDASYALALDVGFVDTGAREVTAQAVRVE